MSVTEDLFQFYEYFESKGELVFHSVDIFILRWQVVPIAMSRTVQYLFYWLSFGRDEAQFSEVKQLIFICLFLTNIGLHVSQLVLNFHDPKSEKSSQKVLYPRKWNS